MAISILYVQFIKYFCNFAAAQFTISTILEHVYQCQSRQIYLGELPNAMNYDFVERNWLETSYKIDFVKSSN